LAAGALPTGCTARNRNSIQYDRKRTKQQLCGMQGHLQYVADDPEIRPTRWASVGDPRVLDHAAINAAEQVGEYLPPVRINGTD